MCSSRSTSHSRRPSRCHWEARRYSTRSAEAGWAAANGLGREDALRSITLDAATVIGVGDRLGSFAVGKYGDVALFDGDPLEFTSHVTGVVIGGRVASDEVR